MFITCLLWISDLLHPYLKQCNGLSLIDGCVFWESRVIVSPQVRYIVQDQLHDTHPGTSKMKA